MDRKILLSFFCSSLLFSALSFADPPKGDCCGMIVSSYLDGSYNYLVRSNKYISGDFNRVFDLDEDGFTLQQAALTVAKQPTEGFGGLADVILGRDALSTASFGYDPDIGIEDIGLDVLQLYGQYAKGVTTLLAGKFVTLVGIETVDPTTNTNFSRGLLFAQTPDTHTGVRGTFAVSDKLKVIFGLDDGWDNIRDWSRGITVEWGIAYNPSSKLSLSAQGYSGEERVVPHTATGPKGWRNLIDLIASYNVNDHLTLAANYDYGTQQNALILSGDTAEAVWQGLATYFNYKFNDLWRVSLRGEIFDDRNGYRTGVPQTLKEITFTVGYSLLKGLELRAETRHDFSNVASFLDREGFGVNENQQSFALECVYKFANRT
ncbi:MAG: outer membrane beta-barrel protein [Candidatus Berkiellales bacterium]